MVLLFRLDLKPCIDLTVFLGCKHLPLLDRLAYQRNIFLSCCPTYPPSISILKLSSFTAWQNWSQVKRLSDVTARPRTFPWNNTTNLTASSKAPSTNGSPNPKQQELLNSNSYFTFQCTSKEKKITLDKIVHRDLKIHTPGLCSYTQLLVLNFHCTTITT